MEYFESVVLDGGIRAKLGLNAPLAKYKYYSIHPMNWFTWHGGNSTGPNIPDDCSLITKTRGGASAIKVKNSVTWTHSAASSDIVEFFILSGYDFLTSGKR